MTDTEFTESAATGFVFEDADSTGLMGAVERALALYKEPLAWRRLQLKGMEEDFGWTASAERYVALYCEASGTDYQAPMSLPMEEAIQQVAS